MTHPFNTHPGSEPLDAELIETFKEAARERGSGYTPRTRHLDKNGRALFTNRLFLETCPYLHQHAHNPVNWYPWGKGPLKEPAPSTGRSLSASGMPPATGAMSWRKSLLRTWRWPKL